MVYHASQQAGLIRLLPRASTHGTPYVYAINHRLTALFFGTPKDDFDLLLDEEAGRPVVYECYPNALERVYSGKPCSLYTLGEEGFLAFQTGWEPELVCPEPAAVVREERIGDILEEILRGASRGECTVHRHSEDEAYQEMLREELGSRARDFGLSREQMAGDWRFPRYFPWLMEGIG